MTAVLLDTGRIAFEFQLTQDPPALIRQKQENYLFETYSSDYGRALLALGLADPSVGLVPALDFWRDFCAAFMHAVLADPQVETKRHALRFELPENEAARFLGRIPTMTGGERITADLLRNVWNDLHRALAFILQSKAESVETILRELSPGHRIFSSRVHFHLVENKNNPDAPFAFLATYSTHAEQSGILSHLPLEQALREYGKNTKQLLDLLASVYQAAKKSPLLESLLDSGEIFHPLGFSSSEALQFLREVPLYEDAGVLCRVPRWWTGSPRSIVVSLLIGEQQTSHVGKDALLSCRPAISVDGEPISLEEAKDILARFDGLALIKGKWIEVDREKIKKNLELFEKAQALAEKEQFTIGEAMQLLLSHGETGAGGRWWEGEIACGAWLDAVLEKLKNPAKLEPTSVPSKIQAELRPYQRLGLSWLVFFYQLGLGCCLADDMGLGKTLQVLALLTHLKEQMPEDYGVSLLIVPASLIGNWLDEAAKFAPGLRIAVAHPQIGGREELDRLKSKIEDYDLILTTYGMARDLKWFSERRWFYVILDEAQSIKNPASAQTRAVKALGAKGSHRLTLTGTPIENRLGDIWSLFDFLNTGLLGSAQAFKRFSNSLEKNPEGYGRLRRVIQPCILRRMKTDKSVILDLPEKVEMKTYAGLSRTQGLLYEQLQQRFFQEIEAAEGMKRRGVILSYLIKFKQVCNHPDHYAGSGAYLEKESGKFTRLRELCETIFEKRERVLVFTQFREIIPALDYFLYAVFKARGATLHGGTPVSQRKGIVDRFQGDTYVPYFILSVKAGGTGLNLTAARHVIHFDRWWNPAVERQAEDRAYRIGQTSRVMVHKFICKGTVEEKIDAMIETKKGLAERVLSGSAGESWITELSTKELRDMFSLKLTEKENED